MTKDILIAMLIRKGYRKAFEALNAVHQRQRKSSDQGDILKISST